VSLIYVVEVPVPLCAPCPPLRSFAPFALSLSRCLARIAQF
jgi:hypothetical protein